MNAAWLPCGPGVEPSCLGTASINDETGARVGGDTVDASVVANTVMPTTEAMLSDKMLESLELLNNNQ